MAHLFEPCKNFPRFIIEVYLKRKKEKERKVFLSKQKTLLSILHYLRSNKWRSSSIKMQTLNNEALTFFLA